MSDPRGTAEFEAIAERRRERRRVERERRGRARRRNLLLAGSVLGVVALAVLITSGGGEPEPEAQVDPDPVTAASPAATEAAEEAAAAVEPISPDTNAAGGDGGGPVPILMYHVISEPPADAELPELFVDPVDFAAQMRYLRQSGFTAITLKQLFASWFDAGSAPERPVVVSFDDGYLSQYVDAFPVLRELGWPGVLNLKVDALEQGELSESQVGELVEDGWELDAHTIHHLDLTTLDDSTLEREIAGSRRILQRRFDVAVDFFCYPAGAYDERVIDAVKAAGYLGATTTLSGLATPERPYELPRIRVDGSDGVEGLAAKLEAAIGEASA